MGCDKAKRGFPSLGICPGSRIEGFPGYPGDGMASFIQRRESK